MKQGDLSPFVGSLRHAIRELHDRWHDVNEVWNDSVAERFHEQHVVPIDAPLTTAVKAVDRLGQIMVKAYDACSPDRE